MAKSSHIRVLLVCSGSNAWDDAGRLSGGVDLPLSDHGFDVVRLMREGLPTGSISQVWSGPEESAGATATEIAETYGVKLRRHEDLREVSLGLWEGMLSAQAEERYPSVFKQWREDPMGVVPPGGESAGDAKERVAGAIREILARTRADETSGVCLVLRPMAFRLARAWLSGEGDMDRVSNATEMCGRADTFIIDRGSLKGGGPAKGVPVRDAG